MIPVPNGAKVWLAMGHTDMQRGMRSLVLKVQQALDNDVHAGDLYVFRGRSGSLCKILWHDGLGMSLYAERRERGLSVCPAAKDRTVAISCEKISQPPAPFHVAPRCMFEPALSSQFGLSEIRSAPAA